MKRTVTQPVTYAARGSKQYKNLDINGKINAKSWGFWRLPNAGGFILTMMDNADSFARKDYANFMRHHLVEEYQYSAPRNRERRSAHNLRI